MIRVAEYLVVGVYLVTAILFLAGGSPRLAGAAILLAGVNYLLFA